MTGREMKVTRWVGTWQGTCCHCQPSCHACPFVHDCSPSQALLPRHASSCLQLQAGVPGNVRAAVGLQLPGCAAAPTRPSTLVRHCKGREDSLFKPQGWPACRPAPHHDAVDHPLLLLTCCCACDSHAFAEEEPLSAIGMLPGQTFFGYY
jgi:hypothetical protein